MKKLFVLLFTCIMVMSLVACGGSSGESADSGESEAVTLTLAHTRPEGSSADLAIREFCDEVTEATNGTVTFEIYPAQQLGDYSAVFERVMIGDVDMQLAGLPTSVDKFFGFGTGAYLASNWDEAKELFSSGGTLMNEVSAKLDEYGITYLCMYPNYFGGIALHTEPIDPTNPDATSGIKIRVPDLTQFELTAEAFGYLATPLASSDTFTALQTGVVDGALGMGAEGYYSNFSDLVDYYLPINDHFETWNLIINKEKFESLSEEQQEAIKEAAANMESKRWEVAEDETAEYEQKLADNGTVIVEFTDEELKAFQEKAREEVWPAMREDFGPDLFDEITKDL